MKEMVRDFFVTGIPFGIVMGLILCIIFGPYIGIALGGVSGGIFGLVLSIFMYIQKKKFRRIGLEITNGKNILYDGAANHFKGVESVGGWLLLTSDAVIFKSHDFNIQKHLLIIPLNKIADVKFVATAKIIPNGLIIIDNEGASERFVINKRKVWFNKINGLLSSDISL